jgi:hypothetical protein
MAGFGVTISEFADCKIEYFYRLRLWCRFGGVGSNAEKPLALRTLLAGRARFVTSVWN